MIVRTRSKALGVLALCIPLYAAPAGVFAPIVNPSFESISRPLAVGEQSNGAGGVGVPVGTRFPFGAGTVSWADPVEVPGWRTLTRPPGDTAVVRAGVLNPPDRSPGVPFIAGNDGAYLVAIQNSYMSQSLPLEIQPDTRYRVRFLGGIGRFDSDYFLTVALFATPDLQRLVYFSTPGVTMLKRNPIPPFSILPDGMMNPFAFQYTTPLSLPPGLAGQYLSIVLGGSDGFPRVCYDDLSLEIRPGPCHFDLTADGQVGWADLSALAAMLGTMSGATFSQGDVDGDADVDIVDFAQVQESYGASCQ